jgi:Flp pilus assembly protein TadD
MHWNLMCRRLALSLGLVLLFISAGLAQKIVSNSQPNTPVSFLDSTKEQDGLAGSVRRVKTEFARVQLKEGRIEEGPLQLLEVTTYALDGHRTENVSYPVPSAPVGKEEYRYDPNGNIIEMTLRANDGSIISREAYDYEFDRLGNWKKMVTSLVVFEAGELKREPVEVTYRTLTYYFDDAVASLVDPNLRSTMPAIPPAITARLKTDGIAATPVFENVSVSAPQVNFNSAPPAIAAPNESEESEKEEFTTADSNRIQPSPTNTEETSPTSPISTTGKSTKFLSSARSADEEREPPPNEERSSPTVEERKPTTVEASPPTNPNRSKALVLYKAGMMNFESGDAKGAVVAYLESLKLEPESALVNISLGHAYIRLKKLGDAIKAYKQATKLNPELAEAHYGLGYCHFEQRQYRDAVTAFKKATKLDPKMAKAHFGLALGYQELGEVRGLMEEYRVLQGLDGSLARRLEQTFPESILPCRAKPFCM